MRNTRIWIDRGGLSPFPELELDAVARTANSAICFSGGGMRAVSATMGQLRGLRRLGLMARIRYISCVSGGARAGIVFTYYRRGAKNDDVFLGAPTAPEDISFSHLGLLERGCLGYLATKDPTATMFLLSCQGAAPDRLWLEAAGSEYLAPFGLYDANDPASFSYDAASVASIAQRNPDLADATFYTVRTEEPRPYLIANIIFVCPTALSPVREYSLVNCEVTPLYAGTPHAMTVRYEPVYGTPANLVIGGGSVEPFAFGSGRLESVHRGGTAAVSAPPAPFRLADVVGTATASFSVDDHNFFGALSPKWAYCPPGAPPPATGTSFNFGDAGYLEDYGLISVLLRKVRSVAVFINTGTKLNLRYDPATPPAADDIDANLPPLFGYANEFSQNNQVFESAAFAEVVRALQAARHKGTTVTAASELTTVPNSWWGLDGGHRVTILWVYNDRVPQWEQRIPPASGIPAALATANSAAPAGPFANFPNYLISGQNAFGSLALTPAQINLLADLSCWNVTANADSFRDLLTAPG